MHLEPELNDSRPAESLPVDELNHALGQGAVGEVVLGIRQIALREGMSQVARATGLCRTNLYRSLGCEGDPKLSTVLKILSTAGLQLAVRNEDVGS